MKRIAFIGTREPELRPAEWVKLYCDAVAAAVQHGHMVVTGGAPGCDQLAANRALTLGGQVMLILPFYNYEREWVSTVKSAFLKQLLIVADPEHHRDWEASVDRYHPAAGSLSRGARMMHSRNFGIVSNSDATVALPSSKPGGGGTGQGIRICRALGIKLFDLSQEEGRAALQAGLLKAPSAP